MVWRRYRWEWRLGATPEELWPLVSNTNRFNRDAGIPAVERLGPGRLRFRRYGVAVEWEEEPFEWVRPERFGVVRRYRRGPLAEMHIRVELVADGSATRVLYEVDARSRGVLGAVAVPVEIGLRSRRRFGRVLAAYARAADEHRPPSPAPSTLAPGGAERLARARERLASTTASDVVARLAETVEHGDELDLAQLRPYALADAWRVPRRDVLDACLHSVRSGLLQLRWVLLCPQCRGPVQQRESLRELDTNEVHCESCGISFGSTFDQSVELRFRPSPAIRAVPSDDFCVGGPQVTPHVVAQQLLAPGEVRDVHLPLEAGRYRLWSKRGSRLLTARPEGAPTPDGEGAVGLTATIRFENSGDTSDLVVLERAAWTDQAVTAAEVTSRQVFRDLFAREALRPGEQLSVGHMAVLFTDLRDSTRFYRNVGDATAFGAVMGHFDVLRRAIGDEGGAIVKTMGDAVMAVLDRPAGAVRAIRRAGAELDEPLVLKAGLHVGACMAVTQNDRLDYFGSTVNIAARLVGLAGGGDIVVSDEVLGDPEVAEAARGLPIAPVEAQLKGFEDTRFALWRLGPSTAP
jgi:class 3 adenylate cyclase